MSISPLPRAIIRITTSGISDSRINYARRMYAIIRRYTPEAVEGATNECFADLTGLRTFFKMTYQEIAEKILEDLRTEIGRRFQVSVATEHDFTLAEARFKKIKKVSAQVVTYKEMNALFVGKAFVDVSKRVVGRRSVKRVRLSVPFLGKVN